MGSTEIAEGLVTQSTEKICRSVSECQCDPSFWKSPAVPQHVLQMFVYDKSGRVLVMHRSEKVRSARNVWSIPTGTHEIGESAAECITRELHEEFHLDAKRIRLLDQYENIAGDEAPPHYHWVLSVYGVLVDDVTAAINKEPDRHDQMIFVPIVDLLDEEFFLGHAFHASFHKIISTSVGVWKDILGVDKEAAQ